MKENIFKYGRIFLGVFLIVYGLNQFLHFYPSGYGKMPDDARQFIDAVVIYLPILYVFEMLIGLFLIINKWSAFILVVLFPLSVSFLIFMYANQDFSESWSALLVALLNIALLIGEREKIAPLFKE
jgi:hypothetical protein